MTSRTSTPGGRSSADAAFAPPRDLQLSLFRMMVLIREFTTAAYDMSLRGFIRGTTHLSIGQEAIAAGFAASMRPDDYSFAIYRGHAQKDLVVPSVDRTVAEILRGRR